MPETFTLQAINHWLKFLKWNYKIYFVWHDGSKTQEWRDEMSNTENIK